MKYNCCFARSSLPSVASSGELFFERFKFTRYIFPTNINSSELKGPCTNIYICVDQRECNCGAKKQDKCKIQQLLTIQESNYYHLHQQSRKHFYDPVVIWLMNVILVVCLTSYAYTLLSHYDHNTSLYEFASEKAGDETWISCTSHIWIHPKSYSDHQKYLENNHAKFECNPNNSS